jgi:NitT/TauT family transport system substrate-binding protein
MKKIKIFLLAFMIFSLGIVNVNATELKRVKIGYSQLRISLPVFVAQEKGIFKKNGLDVELEMFDTAQPLMDALCGGKLDVAGYTAFPITFSAQLRSKRDLVYATALMEDDSHPISMFVIKNDSTISSIAKLKGKRIGILPTYAYKAWLELILEKNGIKPDEVIIQQVAPSMTPAVLESGAVDVMFTNDPAVTACIKKGIGKLLYKDAIVPKYFWSPFPFGSFNMTKEFVQNNPAVAKQIVKSLDEAIDFINSNQQAAKKIMANFLPEAQKVFVESYPDALFLKSTQFSVKELMKVEESYKEQGIVKETLDLSKSLYK